MKIAIFSSWLQAVSVENKILAEKIASYLVENKITTATGGCTGIPAIIIEKVMELGGETIGYSPNKNEKEHSAIEGNHCIDFYSTVHFVTGFTARSLEMIKTVDAAIVINGRIGTLSEFGIAVEEGLPLAVIEGTGGITDELRNIAKITKKEFPNNEVIFEKDYKKAIDALIRNYHSK